MLSVNRPPAATARPSLLDALSRSLDGGLRGGAVLARSLDGGRRGGVDQG